MTPKVRFRAEDGCSFPEWIKVQLANVCQIVGGGTPNSKIKEYWNGDINWFTPTEIGESKYVSKSKRFITEMGLRKSAAKMLPVGTILLTTRATLGEMAITTEPCCTNQGFQSLIARKGYNNEFIFYNQPIIKKYCEIKAQGNTFREINKTELGKCKLFIPSLPEQQKIASFFNALDNLISASNERLNQLQKFKKSMLQRIFSREVRFRAEDGGEFPEWEEKEFCKIFTQRIERNKPDLPPLTVVMGEGTVLRSEHNHKLIFKKVDLPNYKRTIPGDFIIHLNSFETGIEMTKQEGLVSPAYHVYKGKLHVVLPSFYELYFHLHDFIKKYLFPLATGIRQGKSIDIPAFEKSKIPVPSLPEQEKIASFFKSVDDLIAATKGKLTRYKDLKKAMLQRMFA